MNKTHVSILQEMMVKKGAVPNYELIHDGGGTHINTFTYRVSCDGFVATGTGRCKKDAKHSAAKNMLESIASARRYPQLPATPADSPVRTPLPQPLPSSPNSLSNEPFLNAIGELKDLCAENELQEPAYNMISDVGPPHARIFTYQCVVSTFREEGRATTKKQAKHEASRKMLERLLEVVTDLKDKDDLYSSLKKKDDRSDLEVNAEYARSRYVELGKLPMKRVNLGVKLTDYHLKLKKSYTEDTLPSRLEVLTVLDSILDLVQKHMDECNADLLMQLKTNFEQSLAPLNIDISSVAFDCANDKDKVLFLKLNTTPDITETEIGDNIVVMELRAIARAVKTFQLLME